MTFISFVCYFSLVSFSFYFSLCHIYCHILREGTKLIPENLESLAVSSVCPWDEVGAGDNSAVSVSVCPWDDEETPSTSQQAIAR